MSTLHCSFSEHGLMRLSTPRSQSSPASRRSLPQVLITWEVRLPGMLMIVATPANTNKEANAIRGIRWALKRGNIVRRNRILQSAYTLHFLSANRFYLSVKGVDGGALSKKSEPISTQTGAMAGHRTNLPDIAGRFPTVLLQLQRNNNNSTTQPMQRTILSIQYGFTLQKQCPER